MPNITLNLTNAAGCMKFKYISMQSCPNYFLSKIRFYYLIVVINHLLNEWFCDFFNEVPNLCVAKSPKIQYPSIFKFTWGAQSGGDIPMFVLISVCVCLYLVVWVSPSDQTKNDRDLKHHIWKCFFHFFFKKITLRAAGW